MAPRRNRGIGRKQTDGHVPAPPATRVPRIPPQPVPAAEFGDDSDDDPLRELQRMYQSRAVLEVDGVRYVWDFAAQEAVTEADMPEGSPRHHASERARFERFREQFDELVANDLAEGDDAPS